MWKNNIKYAIIIDIRVELMNKKSAFTLAETIMTLFIVGLVVTAAIPVFTQKQDIMSSEVNTPWYNCVNDDNAQIKQGMCGIRYSNESGTIASPSNVVLGGGTPSQWYDLTINGIDTTSSMNDIFLSDKRYFKVQNFSFRENMTNLYISLAGNSFPESSQNSVVIGNASPTGLDGSVIIGAMSAAGSNLKNDVIIGPANEFRGENNVIAGSGIQNTVASNGNVKIGSGDFGLSFSNGALNITDINGNDLISGTKNNGIKIHSSANLAGSLSQGVVTPSDKRLKNIKGEYKKGLVEVLKIEPVVYRYKGSKTLQTGVVAQDIQDVFPEAVVKMPNGYLGINTDPIFFAMLNAMKEVNEKTNAEEQKQIELQKEISELKNEIETLTSCKNNDLWSRIRCFFYDIKLFTKSLISKFGSEVKYEKV